jgi:hypothetical protein
MEWFMNDFCINEINNIINSTMDKGLQPELASVIFSLGRDAENEEEYDFALSKLMELYERDSEDIKAQVIQALAMLAVLHKDIKVLDKSVIEPMILRVAATVSDKNKQIIFDAMRDINQSLGWNLFCHTDISDELFSLHDCIATGAYFRDGKLGFEFEDGFWVLPEHPESGLESVVRTSASTVEFHLTYEDDADVQTYVFTNLGTKQSIRTEGSIAKLVNDINNGKCKVEFLYQYLTFGSRIIECEIISARKPYRRECMLKIDADEVRYLWNNLTDRVW